jgi:5'(3')-deoxyribonucleotidase
MRKSIVYVDMDNVLCKYAEAHAEALIKDPKVAFPQGKYGFYANLEPVKDSIESYNKLKDYFDVMILTRPSVFNPMSYTEKRVWVEKYFGFDECFNLIECSDKTICRGAYLIDDNIQLGRFSEKDNLSDFPKHIHFGTKEFPDWKSILKHFKID